MRKWRSHLLCCRLHAWLYIFLFLIPVPLFYHQCLWAFTTSKNLYYEIISKIYHCVFSPHKLQLTFLFFLSRPFSEQKRPHRSGKRLFCSQIIHFSLLLSKTLIISDPRIITLIFIHMHYIIFNKELDWK